MEAGRRQFNIRSMISNNGAFIAMLILFIAGFILFDSFRTSTNIFNILRQTSYMAIMAVGMTFVIITGGIDLSVSAIFGLSGVLAAMLIRAEQAISFFCILLPVAACAGIGALMA